MPYCKNRCIGCQVFGVLQLRQIFLNRIIKTQFPLLTQLDYGQSCETLGHRCCPEGGGGIDGCAIDQAGVTVATRIDERGIDDDSVADTRKIVFRCKGAVERVNGFSQPAGTFC